MLFRSTDTVLYNVPFGTGLFKITNTTTPIQESASEAYVSIKGPYFDASEVVIGDLTKFNTTQFGTGASTSAVVSKQFANYNGLSPYTYITPQNVVFGDGELYNSSQLKTTGITSSYQYIPTVFTSSDGVIRIASTSTTDAEASQVPTSTQLFQFSGSYTNLKSTEA